MAQPMTLVATPDPEPTNAGCPEGVAFCPGICAEYGDGYHASAFTYMQVKRWVRGKYRKSSLSVSVYRDATKRKKLGKPKVTVITGDFSSDQLSLNPAQTRMLAAHLLNAADLADPIPTGVLVIAASAVRIDDSILTDDGWQNVVGQMVFAESATSNSQVNVWTEERDPESEGWLFAPADPVKVRRPMHGGDAVLNGTQRPIISAVGRCSRCTTDRVITGVRMVSARGVIRVRGRCQTCGKAGQRALAGLTSWAEDNQ